MATMGKCRFCGNPVASDRKKCPACGAANELYVEHEVSLPYAPGSISDLKDWCSERGIPLSRMRFFIGEDFKEPRAFGIYQDGRDFVVYKNKADGKRAVRYRGPDEEHAVNELFMKLMDECHQRGIYPDGKPDAAAMEAAEERKRKDAAAVKKFKRIFITFFVSIWVLVLGVLGTVFYLGHKAHAGDGYYRMSDNSLYYRYGGSWYYNDFDAGWTRSDPPADNYGDYYVGSDYDSDWGGTDFEESDSWKSIHSDNSISSHDYSSWNSNTTNWDSDW